MANPKLTPEQAKAAAEALFADLLAPSPRKVKNATSPKVAIDKLWGSQHSKRMITAGTVKPVVRILQISYQTCLTCGEQSHYMHAPVVRFGADKRKDGLAIETPYALTREEALKIPHEIVESFETVEVCAHCLHHATEAANQPTQLELFI
jgi:hypothetical protein